MEEEKKGLISRDFQRVDYEGKENSSFFSNQQSRQGDQENIMPSKMTKNQVQSMQILPKSKFGPVNPSKQKKRESKKGPRGDVEMNDENSNSTLKRSKNEVGK